MIILRTSPVAVNKTTKMKVATVGVVEEVKNNIVVVKGKHNNKIENKIDVDDDNTDYDDDEWKLMT